jgi:hypothetical protein
VKEKKWGCKVGSYGLTWSVVHCLIWAWVGGNATNARWMKAQFLVHVAGVTGVPGGMTAEGAWMTWHRQNRQMDKQAKKQKTQTKRNLPKARQIKVNHGSKQGCPHQKGTAWSLQARVLHARETTRHFVKYQVKTFFIALICLYIYGDSKWNIREVWKLAEYLNGNMC